MKLWLDDIRKPPPGWLWAKDVGAAIAIVEAFARVDQDWDEASLDHDLGNHRQGDAGKLLLWMIENDRWPRLRPVVHSMNPVGRRNMEALIDRYGMYNNEGERDA